MSGGRDSPLRERTAGFSTLVPAGGSYRRARLAAGSTAKDSTMLAETCTGSRLSALCKARALIKLSCASLPKFRATANPLAAIGDGFVRLAVAGNRYWPAGIDSGIGWGLLGKHTIAPRQRPTLDFTVRGNVPSDAERARENNHRASDEVSVPCSVRQGRETNQLRNWRPGDGGGKPPWQRLPGLGGRLWSNGFVFPTCVTKHKQRLLLY